MLGVRPMVYFHEHFLTPKDSAPSTQVHLSFTELLNEVSIASWSSGSYRPDGVFLLHAPNSVLWYKFTQLALCSERSFKRFGEEF
jgi:hypothetical protein